MKTLSEEQLYFLHDSMTLFMIGLWILIIFLGLKVKNSQQKTYISYGLIGFAFTQEILDYVNRIFLDELYDFKLSTDLPLQFCVIGFYFSIFGIYMSNSKRKFNPRVEQFIFD